MKIKLTHLIMLGLLLGIVVGTFVNLNADAASIKTYTGVAAFGSIIFLKLIKLIIGPLVLSTLIVGVAGIGDAKTVGRMGVKTIGWFIFESLISLTLGLILVNILRPGEVWISALDLDRDAGARGQAARSTGSVGCQAHPGGVDRPDAQPAEDAHPLRRAGRLHQETLLTGRGQQRPRVPRWRGGLASSR